MIATTSPAQDLQWTGSDPAVSLCYRIHATYRIKIHRLCFAKMVSSTPSRSECDFRLVTVPELCICVYVRTRGSFHPQVHLQIDKEKTRLEKTVCRDNVGQGTPSHQSSRQPVVPNSGRRADEGSAFGHFLSFHIHAGSCEYIYGCFLSLIRIGFLLVLIVRFLKKVLVS